MRENILFLLAIVAAAAALPLLVMWLWNWLMPLLFGLPVITYWQAGGLLLLTNLLFNLRNRNSDD